MGVRRHLGDSLVLGDDALLEEVHSDLDRSRASALAVAALNQSKCLSKFARLKSCRMRNIQTCNINRRPS
jgi:hypothetical protein